MSILAVLRTKWKWQQHFQVALIENRKNEYINCGWWLLQKIIVMPFSTTPRASLASTQTTNPTWKRWGLIPAGGATCTMWSILQGRQFRKQDKMWQNKNQEQSDFGSDFGEQIFSEQPEQRRAGEEWADLDLGETLPPSTLYWPIILALRRRKRWWKTWCLAGRSTLQRISVNNRSLWRCSAEVYKSAS